MTALHHALRLAEAGIPVFPCNADKRPVTVRGFHDASTNAAEVREMFGRPGAVLVAIPTGSASGIVVLDGDRKATADGMATLRRWSQEGRLPKTRVHMTRRGGVHLLFRHDPAHPLKSSQSKLAPAVDTRGEGGYAIWWPAAGGTVLRGVTLNALPMAPAWVAEALAEPPGGRGPMPRNDMCAGYNAPTEARLAAMVRLAAMAPEGQRNSVLYWASRRCAEMVTEGVLAPAPAEAVLVAAGRHAGLSEREATATTRSGLNAGGGNGR
jgi:hypothetical protein